MPFVNLIILGAVAGFTIFLGLPLALARVSTAAKGMLNAFAAGILIFLLVDILGDAMEGAQGPILKALSGAGPLQEGALFFFVLLLGLCAGLLGLVRFETRYISGKKSADADRAKNLALMIATGIGLHNFSEGLAIGQSYAGGEITLALTLVVGFGLHNMTEGFGIAAPLAGTLPSRKFIVLLGLIAGGPTFIGALAGGFFASEIMSVLFLSMAGGAVIYVIKGMLYHGRISGEGMKTMGALISGFMAGFITLVLVHLWAR